MTILPAGTFKVGDYRKAIPWDVRCICVIRALPMLKVFDPNEPEMITWVRGLRFDHRPPLQDRPYDTEKGDFDPPQNDPDHIEAVPTRIHDERTFGTKATTLNSDAHNRAHGRRLRDKEARHQVQMAMKRGDPDAISRILSTERRPRPKSKIPSRPFPKRQRSLPRRRANETKRYE